jgi:uncharacterized protein (TIGR03083 family)
MDHVDHLDHDSRRLQAIVAGHDLATPVTTCGDWTLADLAWHLAEVQHFWGWVVASRAVDPSGYVEPARPADDELAGLLDVERRRLVELLRSVDPATPCWSWSTDHTVGFTRRRQAHESLVHRIDAEMAVGLESAVDPDLATDGVDELLTQFLGDGPAWATFETDSELLTLATTDTGRTWTGRFGRLRGRHPDTGDEHDLTTFELVGDESATNRIAATAAELDLWLWGRDRGDGLRVVGDRELADRLRALVAEITQ